MPQLDDIALIKGNTAKLHESIVNTTIMFLRLEKEHPGDLTS